MIAHFLLIRSDVAAATRWQPTNGDPFSHQNAIQRSVWDKLKDTGDVTARGPRGHVETLRNAARWSSDTCGKANYEVRFGHYAAAYFAADVFGDIGHYPGILRIVPVICGTPEEVGTPPEDAMQASAWGALGYFIDCLQKGLDKVAKML
ncbi:hypothetical protein EMWEY_00050160 [Eimeria maxima]|uniref:Uncharacterized protein n=1 Tax=Eimeria maxima TaxID=5804 RepID=U6M9P1_EIMMA|nr:hypothetical protein EMWEY_00050160 [Eimeria maxima]CDJ58380.1 hypothetical protein EMWEY_00050160 [Eimeria maxima]